MPSIWDSYTSLLCELDGQKIQFVLISPDARAIGASMKKGDES